MSICPGMSSTTVYALMRKHENLEFALRNIEAKIDVLVTSLVGTAKSSMQVLAPPKLDMPERLRKEVNRSRTVPNGVGEPIGDVVKPSRPDTSKEDDTQVPFAREKRVSMESVQRGVTPERIDLFERLVVAEADKAMSKQLEAHVHMVLERENKEAVRQDPVYCGAGLERLLLDASDVKPKFDDLGQTLASLLSQTCDAPCIYLGAPVKSQARAAEKIDIEYLGDASRLKDAVRATLVVSVAHESVMSRVYDFLHMLIVRKVRDNKDEPVRAAIVEAMRKASAEVKGFKDRYAKPLGDYADWNLVLDVVGMVCELQINFDVAIARKEGELHVKYEVDRKLNARLLQACLKDDSLGIHMALLAGANAQDRNLKDANGLSPLHYTAAVGNADKLRELLRMRADPLAVDNAGHLPLNQAVRRGHSKVVSVLISAMQLHKRQLSTCSEETKVALLTAWSTSHRRGDSYAEELFQSLFDIAVPADEDKLHYAARAGDEFACEAIIHSQHDMVTKLNKWLFRSDVGSRVLPLDDAILAGSDSAAEILVSKGAMLHYLGPHKLPQVAAENYAIQDRGAQLAALLVVDAHTPSHCDDPSVGKVSQSLEVAKPWGEAQGTPLDRAKLLDLAVKHRSFQVLRVLIEDHGMLVMDAEGDVGVALREAVGNGRLRMASLLLEARAAVDAADASGNTALWFAATAGDGNACELLLKAGAVVDRRCSVGTTALWMAAFCGRLRVVQILQQHGANLDIPSSGNGMTPVNMAAEKGYAIVVEFLRAAGADLDIPQHNGLFPLLVSAQYGNADVVKVLCDAGSDLQRAVAAGTKYAGNFSLSIAARFNHADVVSVLLEGRADVNQVHAQKQMTPLDFAEEEVRCGPGAGSSRSRELVVHALRSAGAKRFKELTS